MEPNEAVALADRITLASGETKMQLPNRQLSAPSRFSPPVNGTADRKLKLLETELASLRKLQDKSLTIDKVCKREFRIN